MGDRTQKDEFLAAETLRGADLQIKQRAGKQRQQRNRPVSVEIVFCERNQCQFHEMGVPNDEEEGFSCP